ncbi:succinoglycan biosynthesis protein ExoV [Alkalispirillum mobile]|uniref:Succinoglycan biosynthesis protein ExoV n=1 Tax=Alkalispirillum mobile TaxID=85925 RepID=A0A498CH21_9GAMM|nr:polysaccharide pyruvyl transferase family protein [Alkalispirillum mobile]RLK51641.1 succinoglycan biosynthesis protein ExoV [Alkalispirillum mobile]
MYLYCYRKRPNFGDALNDYLWPRFIDAPLEPTPSHDEVFVGIGTILNERLPTARRLHIFGSGLGYGEVAPSARDNWHVHFVRGPHTAQALGLDPQQAITDPAILLHRTEDVSPRKDIHCAFMPHHGIHSPRLERLVQDADVHYINPEAPCTEVIDQLMRSRRLICSAMHGAIAAEALRVPWLPVITHHEILLSKWHDWAASMNQALSFYRLPTIWAKAKPTLSGRLVAGTKTVLFRKRLASLAKGRGFQLGSDRVLLDRLTRIEERIDRFNQNILS